MALQQPNSTVGESWFLHNMVALLSNALSSNKKSTALLLWDLGAFVRGWYELCPCEEHMSEVSGSYMCLYWQSPGVTGILHRENPQRSTSLCCQSLR